MMTEHEQQIAIAEWMGICIHPQKCRSLETIEDGNDSDTSHYCSKCKKDYIFDGSAKIPDYPNDLNAMHEAEKKLRDNSVQWSNYGNNIAFIVKNIDCGDYENGVGATTIADLTHGTSKQRSEALCRTLWPERFKE